MVVPGQPGYQDNVSQMYPDNGDLAKAKQILTSAGYTGVGTALVDPSGAHRAPGRNRPRNARRGLRARRDVVRRCREGGGIGAAVSPALGGWVMHWIGYPPTFLVLGGLGLLAAGVWITLGAAVKEY